MESYPCPIGFAFHDERVLHFPFTVADVGMLRFNGLLSIVVGASDVASMVLSSCHAPGHEAQVSGPAEGVPQALPRRGRQSGRVHRWRLAGPLARGVKSNNEPTSHTVGWCSDVFGWFSDGFRMIVGCLSDERVIWPAYVSARVRACVCAHVGVCMWVWVRSCASETSSYRSGLRRDPVARRGQHSPHAHHTVWWAGYACDRIARGSLSCCLCAAVE